MLRVGLTGGIASGKSTVCLALHRLGAQTIDADEIAREVVLPGRPAWQKLRQVFEPKFFQPDGTLNRRRVRKLVFAAPEKLRQLNTIVHPEVMREIQRRSRRMAKMVPDTVLVVDVPLLFEVGAKQRFDQVVVVSLSENLQLERLMRRDGFSLEEAKLIIDAQMPLREKAEEADFVIDNSGSLEETLAQVEEVWRALISRG